MFFHVQQTGEYDFAVNLDLKFRLFSKQATQFAFDFLHDNALCGRQNEKTERQERT